MVVITLLDGKKRSYEKAITGVELAKELRLDGKALAMKVNGELKDLFLPIEQDANVQLLTFNDAEGKAVFWHTTAHVFARFISVLCVHAGVRVGHQPDTKQLLPSLGSFKPTFLLAVPRVFEKVYNVSEQKAEAGGKGRIIRPMIITRLTITATLANTPDIR